MDFDLVIDWLFSAAPFILGIIFYSSATAVTSAIADRYGFDGHNAPPSGLVGILWPIILISFILWWTVFVPSRIVYFLAKPKS